MTDATGAPYTPPMAADVTIREAAAQDGPLLADIERRTPLQLGDLALAIDRRDDYFAASRLMGDATVLIAELDGVAVGVFCAAAHPAMIGGIERRMLYIHHARILPEAQDRGIGKRLGDAVRAKYAGRTDSNYFFIAPGNLHSQAFARRAENRWSVQPTLIDLPTNELAGPMAGRPATVADAALVVSLVNAAHAGEEMFLPYTIESFIGRMERAPEQYSWNRVWLSERAVVGVWPEGESISAWVTPRDGEPRESRAGAVLDFGFEPGGEEELVALLRAWCGWLSSQGMSSLSIFSSPGTRHWSLLQPLGESRPFDFWTPSIPEPAAAAAAGVYTDHIYF